MKRIVVCALAVMAFIVGCRVGDEEKTSPFYIAWVFPTGDCASHGVTLVRLTITTETGEKAGEKKTSEFACSSGRGFVGNYPGGTYGVLAEGLNTTGKVVVQNLGTSATFEDRTNVGDLPVGLYRTSDVVVTWKMSNGGTCPSDVQLPYFIAIYRPPKTTGGMLTEKVKEVQQSCDKGTATIPSMLLGTYVIELDSRTETPRVKGTQDLTLKPGENVQVTFQF